MNVFITGATGFIGSVVAEKLREHGHDVLALAHSDATERTITDSGYRVLRGGLTDAAMLAAGAAQADGVIHLALPTEGDKAAVDTAAVRAMLEAVSGTKKPFIYTSGAWVLGKARAQAADERSPLDALPLIGWRAELEAVVLAFSAWGIVLRPAVAHGRGGGIPGMLTASARETGVVRLVEPGTQRWPFVHVDDLAELYVRALGAPAGSVLHGVSEPAVRMREVADAAAAHASDGVGAVVSWPLAEARAALGGFADALALDQHVESVATQTLLDWKPRRVGVLEDLQVGSYMSQEEDHLV